MYGERIRQLRKEKGLTLRELSDELDIPFTTLGNYEREDRQPNFETFECLAKYFGVTIDYLSGRTEERTFDEYVLNNDFKDLQKLIAQTTPEARTIVTDIFDQVYLIVGDELRSDNVNMKEMEHVFEVINFIFRLKNKLVWSKSQDDFFVTDDSYEFTKQYLKEKQLVDKHFNDLLDIYANDNFN
ncbi:MULTISPECIES: helix-turn-helix domain-containing protein [Priestia]|uniref:helix-turn-helix domain-containing protein n=2 Tax=Bacillaceae TaxID=186817 RepID=UPI001128C404|nr:MULTISPECIES: helix-turn-helix transcriptional regulator [Priestia]